MTALPRVPEGMFSFTSTERADLHTAVMYAFGEANERLETSLTFDQVRDRLRTGTTRPWTTPG